MSIYVIADLHLSFSEEKPMNIFGENWSNHSEKIKKNWLEKVKEDDTVVIPGDFSWAMYLEETKKDFDFLNNLPGKKILLKGNHDYWWTTITKMKTFLNKNNYKNIDFLYNNSFCVENKILTGTRGWNLLDTENSKKMINREVNRLKISIQNGIEQFGNNKEIITFFHYPPINRTCINSYQYMDFVNVLKKYGVKKCYYGHLHGKSYQDAVEGDIQGIKFKLVSSDYLDFDLLKIK